MMREASISFPMLGDWSIDPPASFTLFGHDFYFYGLIIAVGFLLAILYCSKKAPRFGLTEDNLFDLIIWVLPIGIICARLYFVAFQWADYKDDPVSILYVWNGGLAIYGGIIGGALTIWIWSRARRIPVGATLDLCALGVLIGQLVGRWGNFMNREAFGAETNAFCRMGLTLPGQETLYVHPTFLYESLWNLVGFVLLSLFYKKSRRRYDGQGFLLYVLWYGLGRMWIEGLRTDSLYLWGTGVRVSQVLAGLSAAAAAAALIYLSRREPGPLFVHEAESAKARSEQSGGSDSKTSD